MVCQITTDLTAVAPRDDCPACQWAFDLEIQNTTVVVDVDGACMSVHGIDADSAASWDGTTKSYGYDPDYVGHAQILMFWDGARWVPATYAVWDEGASTIDYDWLDGYYDY